MYSWASAGLYSCAPAFLPPSLLHRCTSALLHLSTYSLMHSSTHPLMYSFSSALLHTMFCSVHLSLLYAPGSKSGEKQCVKLLQNVVYSTFQHPPPPSPTATHCLYTVYCTFSLGRGRGGGGQREGRGATVHKYSSFIHGGNSSQDGSKISTMSECISSL